MKYHLASAILILSASCVLALFSQESENREAGPNRMRVMTSLEFSMTGTPESVPFVKDGETWAAALDGALSRSKRVRSVKRATADDDLIAQATRAGYQAAVSVSVLLETGSDTASANYRIVDVLSRKTVAENAIAGPVPFIYELSETFWIPLIVELEKMTVTERHGRIRVRAEPGTRLYGFGETPVTVGAEGEISIDIFVPGTYSWRAVRKNTRNRTGVFTAIEEDALLVIPAEWLSHWSLETGLVMAQFPDVWFGVANIRNRFFFRLGIEQYLFGLYFPTEDSPESYNNSIVSLPLVMPGMTAGFYFGDTAQFIRPYLSASAFLRFNRDLGVVDPVGPLAARLMTGFDWRMNPEVAFFGEFGGTFYPGANGQLLVASRGSGTDGSADQPSPVFYFHGGDYYLELPAFRFGARFSL